MIVAIPTERMEQRGLLDLGLESARVENSVVW